MIYQLSVAVGAALQAKGCPFPVYHRESTKATTWRNAIVFERMPKESVEAPRGLSDNPKRHYQRIVAGKATIYAQATVTGAKFFEHELVGDEVIDMTLIALRKLAREYGVQITGSERVPIDDLEKSEAPGGIKHEITFTLARGVTERTWAGAIGPTFEITEGSVIRRTDVRLAHAPEDAVVATSCGEAP